MHLNKFSGHLEPEEEDFNSQLSILAIIVFGIITAIAIIIKLRG